MLSNGSVLLRGNVAWAYLCPRRCAHSAEVVGSGDVLRIPDPNTALVHYLLGAIELREGDVKHAVDRCRDASAQIRAHGQSWIDGVPWLAEVELWAGRVEPALQVLEEALEVTLPTQALMTAALVCWCARAHADRLDAARAPASERRRLVGQLRAAVASARTDPFGVADCDVSVPAYWKSWRAELARIDGTESVADWASAAAEWDRITPPARRGVLPLARCRGRPPSRRGHDCRSAPEAGSGRRTSRTSRSRRRSRRPPVRGGPHPIRLTDDVVLSRWVRYRTANCLHGACTQDLVATARGQADATISPPIHTRSTRAAPISSGASKGSRSRRTRSATAPGSTIPASSR